jgi:hypothetical protein
VGVGVFDPSNPSGSSLAKRRSNHDRYGVTGHASATNLFLNHSASGRARRGRVYSQFIGEMLLVGLDLSPMPGPNRPVNFLGVMHQAVLEELDLVLDQRAAVKVVFGHYPIGQYYPRIALTPTVPSKVLSFVRVVYVPPLAVATVGAGSGLASWLGLLRAHGGLSTAP